MKILYSCLSKSWGGMEMITVTSLKKLLERGYEVTLLCNAESRIHTEANNLGIIIHAIKSGNANLLFNIFRLKGIIQQNHFDIIHTQASNDLWLLIPALKLSGEKIPTFLTKHVGSYIVKKDILHRYIYKNVDKVFAISNVIEKNLMETCPLNSEQVELLHNGIDISHFTQNAGYREMGREKLKVNSNEILIGMMGRFSPGKGHEEFLLAGKELNEKYKNLKFVVVGEASRGEEQYENKIKKSADELGLKNIIFTGYISDVRETLSAMDIFVFPSHAEAFGLGLAEAMAMGLPTVCSNSDGVLDIAVDNETSLLFENKNHKSLVDKIDILINSEEKRINLGINGRMRIVNKFDLEKQTEKVIKIYSEYAKKSNKV